MQYRDLGRTGWKVSAVSFGSWAIGGTWGPVKDAESLAALHRAIELGVNFFDTADVYGDGRSERLLGQLRRQRSETIYIATKAGRRLDPHVVAGYNRANLTAFVERSLKNLDTGKISDDSQLVEAFGHEVTIVEADASNIKITRQSDIAIAEAILKSRPKPVPKGPAGPYIEAQW